MSKAMNDAAIQARRLEVARFYARRVTQEEIAKVLKVDQATISRDIVAIKKEWRKEYAREIEEHRARELAELDQMEKEAALEFSQSKRRDWWEARLKAKERRAKLLGLDAPTRQDITSGGEPIKLVNIAEDVSKL